MRFEVETERGRRTIEVKRAGDAWTATVDGRVVGVDFRRVDMGHANAPVAMTECLSPGK